MLLQPSRPQQRGGRVGETMEGCPCVRTHAPVPDGSHRRIAGLCELHSAGSSSHDGSKPWSSSRAGSPRSSSRPACPRGSPGRCGRPGRRSWRRRHQRRRCPGPGPGLATSASLWPRCSPLHADAAAAASTATGGKAKLAAWRQPASRHAPSRRAAIARRPAVGSWDGWMDVQPPVRLLLWWRTQGLQTPMASRAALRRRVRDASGPRCPAARTWLPPFLPLTMAIVRSGAPLRGGRPVDWHPPSSLPPHSLQRPAFP